MLHHSARGNSKLFMGRHGSSTAARFCVSVIFCWPQGNYKSPSEFSPWKSRWKQPQQQHLFFSACCCSNFWSLGIHRTQQWRYFGNVLPIYLRSTFCLNCFWLSLANSSIFSSLGRSGEDRGRGGGEALRWQVFLDCTETEEEKKRKRGFRLS